jgi:hypothetical protein
MIDHPHRRSLEKPVFQYVMSYPVSSENYEILTGVGADDGCADLVAEPSHCDVVYGNVRARPSCVINGRDGLGEHGSPAGPLV